MIALAFGFFFILVVVPLIVLTLMSMVDEMARQDKDVSKAVWLGLLLFVPLFGLAMYWLQRPTSYDPYAEPATQPFRAFHRYEYAEAPAGAAAARPVAQPRMTPALQGGADPEPAEDEDISA
jgi:hypothetical protein